MRKYPLAVSLVKDGEIIGRGHNAREELQRAVMHAEVMAIEEANQREESWRLLDTTLFVTIEPCVMCSGAIGLARIPQVDLRSDQSEVRWSRKPL